MTALVVSACGSAGGQSPSASRPANPVNLTVYVNDSRVSVSPTRVGAGPITFIVTNQAGVARGYYEEDHVTDLHAWMNLELRKVGAHIDGVEFSPYHPEGVVERYRRDSDLRKPGPGMLKKLMAEWPVDVAGSFMVGDRQSDVEAAAAAGIPGHLFAGGNLFDFVRTLSLPRRRTAGGG